jgi:hypothetical protein
VNLCRQCEKRIVQAGRRHYCGVRCALAARERQHKPIGPRGPCPECGGIVEGAAQKRFCTLRCKKRFHNRSGATPAIRPIAYLDRTETPGAIDAKLTHAVWLECQPPWIKHPQPYDPRDIKPVSGERQSSPPFRQPLARPRAAEPGAREPSSTRPTHLEPEVNSGPRDRLAQQNSAAGSFPHNAAGVDPGERRTEPMSLLLGCPTGAPASRRAAALPS